ncbi:hypothetical protein JD844_005694 [Phrynosoma platyrhinos]|uniref:Uncharacterized protein n=1 Tax=Phrynosoma platyrhinos TaxID=52577 RepID=A0ABQ7TNY0_PHRPL|nr:hypothetical protein JD844_005694 [Phrynosoma platyrhinos]
MKAPGYGERFPPFPPPPPPPPGFPPPGYPASEFPPPNYPDPGYPCRYGPGGRQPASFFDWLPLLSDFRSWISDFFSHRDQRHPGGSGYYPPSLPPPGYPGFGYPGPPLPEFPEYAFPEYPQPPSQIVPEVEPESEPQEASQQPHKTDGLIQEYTQIYKLKMLRNKLQCQLL